MKPAAKLSNFFVLVASVVSPIGGRLQYVLGMAMPVSFVVLSLKWQIPHRIK